MRVRDLSVEVVIVKRNMMVEVTFRRSEISCEICHRVTEVRVFQNLVSVWAILCVMVLGGHSG